MLWWVLLKGGWGYKYNLTLCMHWTCLIKFPMFACTNPEKIMVTENCPLFRRFDAVNGDPTTPKQTERVICHKVISFPLMEDDPTNDWELPLIGSLIMVRAMLSCSIKSGCQSSTRNSAMRWIMGTFTCIFIGLCLQFKYRHISCSGM